jgi:hypothetical protein
MADARGKARCGRRTWNGISRPGRTNESILLYLSERLCYSLWDETPKTEQPMERNKGREWTVRLTGPVRYRRYTGLNNANMPSIFFAFDAPPGQKEVPKDIYDVIKSVKHLVRGAEHGGGLHDTGLEYRQGIWRLPDTEFGRTAADVLDARLADLATKMERDGNER